MVPKYRWGYQFSVVKGLEQRSLSSVRCDAEVLIGEHGSHAPSGSAVQEADLDQKRFIDFLDSIGLFRERGGQRVHSDRAALILLDDRQKELAVHLIEAVLIDFQHLQRGLRGGLVDLPASPH